jgi:hypothetical protein
MLPGGKFTVLDKQRLGSDGSRQVAQLGTGEQKLKTREFPAMEEYKLRSVDHLFAIESTPLENALLLVVGSIVLSLLASWFIDVNRFSTHGLLRNRLVRAYLGASNPHRAPSPFTGFDPNDDIPISALLRRPLHIVNMCLNLATGGNLAWRQRHESSFTASPLLSLPPEVIPLSCTGASGPALRCTAEPPPPPVASSSRIDSALSPRTTMSATLSACCSNASPA